MNNELKYMLEMVTYLSRGFDEQYCGMESFARWNLPEEIGLEWIDAEGIIRSENLAEAIDQSLIDILLEILNNFSAAFASSNENNIWTFEGMKTNPFWIKQRELAKKFLHNYDSGC